jgi:GT2 family glycosyltransferase
MTLLVVIANYRVAHLTIDCLRSLASEIARVPGMRVAVCENGTEDDSAERIQQAIDANGWQAWCTLTVIRPNRGFTGGNNVILRPAMASDGQPEYFLLLNSDTIVRANAVKALVEFMDANPSVGVAGSRLEDPDGTPQRSAFRFHTPLGEFEANVKLGLISQILKKWIVAPPVDDRTFETDWVCGASMIVRREVFRDIGVLDEGYYTYFEDVDLCFNARKAGWPIWYVPTSRVIHLGSQTTGVSHKTTKRLPSYALQARRRYFLKNHGPLYAALADAGMIAGAVLWRLRVILTGKPDSTPPKYLRDCVMHSVFLTGFALKDVRNPALG